MFKPVRGRSYTVQIELHGQPVLTFQGVNNWSKHETHWEFSSKENYAEYYHVSGSSVVFMLEK